MYIKIRVILIYTIITVLFVEYVLVLVIGPHTKSANAAVRGLLGIPYLVINTV